jgi:tRNA(Arg) A34 adenosine deaminase TadA
VLVLVSVMSKVERYFRLAKKIATKGDITDVKRKYRLGAVGIRTDGTIVTANNIPCRYPHARAYSHAEARLVRKLSHGSEMFVVRILRNNSFSNACPCAKCQNAMRLRGVRRVYYSISDDEYGVIVFARVAT